MQLLFEDPRSRFGFVDVQRGLIFQNVARVLTVSSNHRPPPNDAACLPGSRRPPATVQIG